MSQIKARGVSRLITLAGMLVAAACSIFAQASSPCQPPITGVAVYDFVPSTQLQSSDFRPLLKSGSAFVIRLRDAENLDVSDFTTQIVPADIMPDPPRITGALEPQPSQLAEPYFVVGQIARAGNGFLLSVQLKRSADSSTLDEIKT